MTNPRAVIGNNQPPLDPFDIIKQEIEDLFDEARNFADGEPISSAEMHDAIEKLYDGLHDAGKRADTLRVAEKKPLDDMIAAIQAKFNPLIQPKKGKVDIGKAELGTLLAVWRKKVADEKAAAAAAARAEADRIAAEARAALQASAGNLTARVDAEELAAHARDVERMAKRADKAATTGLGLRSVWSAVVEDWEAAMDWAYGRDPGAFRDMVQGMADTAVRTGARTIPGVRAVEDKVAV